MPNSAELSKIRVLLADDQEAVHLLFRKVLCPQSPVKTEEPDGGAIPIDFTITTCTSGEDAVELTRQALEQDEPFALAFIDIFMPPGKGGEWAMEQIRSMDSDVILIVISGEDAVQPSEIAANVPPADKLLYLHKPFNLLEIRQVATAMAAKWELDRQMREILSELEQRIVERTRELETANQQLTKALEEMRRAEKQLSESEELVRLMVAHAPVAIAMFDTEMRCLMASRRWLEINNQTTEIIGQCFYDVMPDIPERWIKSHMRALDGASEACAEDRIERADGAVDWVRWEVHPWYRESGEVGGIVMFCEYINDRIKAREERERLEEQLHHSQKMDALGKLAGGIAHDFNNLLQIINGNSELLFNEIGDPVYHDKIMEILSAGDHAASLTRQLLAFSRKQTHKPRVLDLNIEVSKLGRMLKRLIGASISLDIQINPEPLMIRADVGKIQNVLINLAINARDAMPQQGKLSIHTSAKHVTPDTIGEHFELPPGEYAQIMVCDTGVGMDEQIKSRIFEPFFTTKPMSKGTGLGLSTVYGFVRQNQGAIQVESEPDKGTTFYIYFPRLSVSELIETEVAAPVASSISGSETILVVDDEPSVLKITAGILKKNGYRVIAAERPKEALEKLKSNSGKIDLMLTDVIMPEMDGVQLGVHAKGLCPELRVLYMSGFSEQNLNVGEDVIEGSNFIAKPFTINELTVKVKDMLERA
ncbi:response regulator [Candidatus Sumerlaeota bacterium]|nr:response regulator [Candidatus Sumerlaeota bacterium]